MRRKKNNRYKIALCLLVLLVALFVVIGNRNFKNPNYSTNENTTDTAINSDSIPVSKPVPNLLDQSQPVEPALEFVPNQILAKFEKTVTIERINQILQVIGGETIKQYASTPGLYLISLPNTVTVEDARTYLSTISEIQYSEENIIYSIQDFPNDPFFNLLWGLHNFGQNGGKPNIDINAPEAWVDTKGSSEIVIGVIDTGIDYTHPDLAPNIWINPSEIPNNNIDDDNNGWIDDVHGINAILGNGDPMDDHGHGTHVSGTIAANGNDGIGITGVMWQASIVGCKFLNNNGEGYLSDALTCLDYFSSLSDAGINIVATNNSWGGGRYSAALFNAIQEHNNREILFVAAAGNSSRNLDTQFSYPASYDIDNVISVAAIDRNGEIAGFSNFGSNTVDIAAPGVEIYSTLPSGQWGYKSGTSMAAPHVTGIIGLTKAIAPELTGPELKSHILNTAVNSDELAGKIIDGRRAVINLPFIDGDGDQIDDRWERKYGLDENDPSDAALDLDGDGLSNLEEFVLGTLPNNPDSDNDSLTDGSEINVHGTDPLNSDSDSDGLQDGLEVNTYLTNPTKADTDDDGLDDYAEINTFATNPLSPDSDNDTLTDGWEVSFNLNPNDSSDANADADNDGLTNVQEFNQGTSPILADTDSDGINDYDEVNTHNTDPTDADSDGDRILDGWEVSNSFDPLDDSDAYDDPDGDGYSNFQEFKGGTDPHDLASHPPNNGWYTLNGGANRNPVGYIVSDSNFFTTRWSITLSQDVYQNHLTAVDKNMYLRFPKQLSKIELGAYSLANGRQNWNKTFFEASSLKEPTYTNGQTYLQYSSSGIGTEFIGLDSETGEELSEIIPDDYADSYVAYDGDLFYSTYPNIFRIDGTDGGIVWQIDKNYSLDSAIAISDSYLATLANQTLYSYNVVTGADSGSPIPLTCNVGQYNNLILDVNYAYSYGANCIAKVDLDTDQILWEINDNKGFKGFAYLGTSLYLLTNNSVEVRDAATGSLVTTMATGNFDNMVLTRNHLFLSGIQGTIALDLSNGQEVWTDTVGGLLAIDESGGLVIQSRNNVVKVINLDGDSDSDGLPNWWERFYRLNSLDAGDATADFDSDGLSNLEEFANSTDPNKADTDGDALNDIDEINTYQTSPLEPDSDFDGLSDAEEINVYGTNPILKDTDSDGFIDGDEVSIFKTDPNDYLSQPPKIKSYAESFESEFPVKWSIAGDATSGWIIDTTEFTDGSASLRSGSIQENQLSAFEWVDYFSSGQLSFNLKVTDQGCCYTFKFYIDGELKYYSDGTDGEWQPVSVFVNAGQRSLRWEFVENRDISTPENVAYIDQVRFKYSPLAGDPSDILVVNGGDLREFNTLGELVAGPFKFSNGSGDLVITNNHEIAISVSRYLYIYNPDTGSLREIYTYSQNEYQLDKSLVNAGEYLVASNSYGGVILFTQNGEFVDRALLGQRWWDLKVGPQGNLYGLTGENFPAPVDRISVISPSDFSLLKNINLPDTGITGFEINESGELFLLKGDSTIIKTDSDGNELRRVDLVDQSDQLQLRMTDLNIQDGGIIYAGSFSGQFYALTQDLTLLSENEIPNWSTGFAYVATIGVSGPDSDVDGIPNWWEIRHGLNPANANDAQIDTDGDGLTNVEEFNRNTYPDDSDTDDDGLSDGNEVNTYQSNPRSADTDKDGLSDGDEVTNWNTSPIYSDTDQDGVSDYDEVIVYGLDPLNHDTDGDQQSDGWELANRLSPIDASDADLDLDRDGLTNLEEFIANSNIYRVDSDFDSLSDFSEVNVNNTLPNKSDTDGDGMDDGWEVTYGFDPLVSNDGSIDSDSDGYSDFSEFYTNSNPINANIRPSIPSWVTYQGNAQHSGYIPLALDEADFVELWQATPYQSFPRRFHQATADFQYAYVMNSEGLYVLSLRDGQVQWQNDLGIDYSSKYGQASIDLDSVYIQTHVTSESILDAFDIHSGQNIFSSNYTAQGFDILSPTPFKDSIYIFGGQFGGIYSFDKQGNQRWFKELQQYYGWSPAVDNKSVYTYVGDQFSVFDRFDGSLTSRWVDNQFKGAGTMDSSPVISEHSNAIFVQDDRLINLSLPYAFPSWTKDGIYEGQPAVSGGIIYVLSVGKLLAVDEDTGEEQWRFVPAEYLNRNIVVTLNHVFVASNSKTWAVDRHSGASVWEWNQGGHLSLSPNGVLLISQDDGTVTAIQTIPDDDNDGLSNAWELSSGTQVNVPGDESNDDDNDGLTNLEEFQFGTSGQSSDSDADGLTDGEEAHLIGSNPSNPDTDRDGLNDGDEVNTFDTDPLEVDTDRDGIDDMRELNLGTDPLRRDSDGDGFDDGLEDDQGTDPLDGSDVPNTLHESVYDFENQEIPANWRVPINAHRGWSISNQQSYDGTFSLRSDVIGDNEVAAIEWKILTDDVEIQFDLMTSSELFNDEFTFYVDGEEIITDLRSDWHHVSANLPLGLHTLRWEYQKNGYDSRDDDAAYIDNIVIRPANSAPPSTPSPSPAPSTPPPDSSGSSGSGGGGTIDWFTFMLLAGLLAVYQRRQRFLFRA